ncbi:hypothetical protein VHEMI09139 [[Torrubiella] hemipterigena]|uniref:2EXR domain-containing protein n=1 Tax=[Torrubiella] hemipterigena TaxID=1531966 RepID=A0A0A1TFK2_9HYPO|nr:hypothetical protein VHEMI09139 [[Torrubiella] hemipterigena]
MATLNHLRIINAVNDTAKDDAFSRFPELPLEIRLMIWKLLVNHHRLIDLTVGCSLDNHAANHVYAGPGTPQGPTAATPYFIDIQGWPINNPILYANRESRTLALDFYRVQLPFYPKLAKEDSPDIQAKRVFYFSPEHDILHISTYGDSHSALFFSFLNEVQQHDPKRLGLLNWAADECFVRGFCHERDLLGTSVKDAFIGHLSRIREVFLMINCKRSLDSDLMAMLERRDEFAVELNCSMPIRPSVTYFQESKPDSRAIGPDLQRLILNRNTPLELFRYWAWLQQQIPCAGRVRLLLARDADPNGAPVDDARSAQELVTNEYRKWRQLEFTGRTYIARRKGGPPPLERPEVPQDAVRPAIGFWLFPVEALRNMLGRLERYRIYDASEYHPELVLAELEGCRRR